MDIWLIFRNYCIRNEKRKIGGAPLIVEDKEKHIRIDQKNYWPD